MNLRISHKDSYILIDFDIENENATIIDNKANDFLNVIFGDKNYYEIKRWLIFRCGGKKTLEETINLCKTNKGVSVVDNITIEII